VQQRRKGATAAAARAASTKDFTKYDLTVGETEYENLSKQAAVRLAVTALASRGVPVADLREATHPKRWISVTPTGGESVEQAFRREHPARGDNYWFDLDLSEGDWWWVMPRLGGRHTEGCLTELARVSEGAMSWSAVGAHEGAGEEEEPVPGLTSDPAMETPPVSGMAAQGTAAVFVSGTAADEA
jgi:hypothetical protein